MIAEVGRKPGDPANTYQDARWERLKQLPQGRHPDGWYSLTPTEAREIEEKTNGEGPGILYLDERHGTCLRIPRAYRAPIAGDNSPWGIITETRDMAYQIVEVKTERHGGVWLGWDRVRSLPADYVPFTGHHSWAERMNDAPMVLSFFLVDADHEKAAKLGRITPGRAISRNKVGIEYFPPYNWRVLKANWFALKSKRAKDAAKRFTAKLPELVATVEGWRIYEHPEHGDTATLMALTPSGQQLDTESCDVPAIEELRSLYRRWQVAP